MTGTGAMSTIEIQKASSEYEEKRFYFEEDRTLEQYAQRWCIFLFWRYPKPICTSATCSR